MQRQAQQRRGGEATLNMEELRELTELFSAHGLTDFEFENADIRIRLSRTPAPVVAAPVVSPAQALTPLAALQSAAGAAAPAAGFEATPTAPQTATGDEGAPPSAGGATAAETPDEELHLITSPIVGTFYRSPSPSAVSNRPLKKPSAVCLPVLVVTVALSPTTAAG